MSWQGVLADSITSAAGVEERFPGTAAAIDETARRYPMRINSYYWGLIRKVGGPLWRQAVPSQLELDDKIGVVDPLAEESLSPVANLVHKYPDRVLFLVNNQCAMYCRFCTRKRKVGTRRMPISDAGIEAGLDYIRRTPAVREVLMSGGDPFLMSDERLDWILGELRAIPGVEIIRIGTRTPCVLPMRITVRLTKILRRYHPLYINTHFNHPAEITPQAAQACTRLADAGIPLGCQTVLLRGVNDDPQIIRDLLCGLLKIRVKPYYLFQGDLTRGANHFRTPVAVGLAIMKSLIGHVSGMAIPVFAVDAPGGGGKIPLLPDYKISYGRELIFENYCGRVCSYPDVTGR
ncbi:MAG: KamA family radical SAM protein [Deltaproteobacteria bacterium]|nr:KamA family radical SAM protein [Deltaproteobacteria bacterium]